MPELQSVVPLVQFPALPTGTGAMALAVQFQLDQTQWLPPPELFALQRRQLQLLLHHASESVPFYRQRLAGFDPGAMISPETFATLPVLTREDIQGAGEALRSTRLPASHGQTHLQESSGSTGRSVQVLGTDLTQFFWQAFTLREHYWHGRDASLVQAAIRWAPRDKGQPPGVDQQGWGKPFDELYATGQSVFLNIACDTATQAEWLRQVDPHYFITHPSQALTLIEHFERHGLRLPRLRELRTVGETVTAELRAACRAVWGVGLTDLYSCEEAGLLALQCPEHDHYHVQAENVYLEVVDDSGRPCRPGDSGRVLVTALHNFATPLIRYELGDYAEPGEACACGRGLPVLARLLGRRRNRLVLPGGETRFPYLGERADYRAICPGVREFQFVQHDERRIELKLVIDRHPSVEDEQLLCDLIRRNLGYPFEVTISYHDRIVRGGRHKHEEFVSHLTAGRAASVP